MGEGAVLPEANSAFVCLFKDFFAPADFSTGRCLLVAIDKSKVRAPYFGAAPLFPRMEIGIFSRGEGFSIILSEAGQVFC